MNWTVLGTQMTAVRRRPGRGLMTGLSLLVASFVVFATVLSYRITTETFLDSFSDTSIGTTLVAESEQGFRAGQLRQVRSTAGVSQASGRISGSIPVTGPAGRSLNLDAGPAQGPLATWTLDEGVYPSGPDELAVSRATADDWSVGPGSRLRLLPPDPRTGRVEPAEGVTSTRDTVEVTVTGVVDSQLRSQAYAPDATVAALLKTDTYERIDIAGSAGLHGLLTDVLSTSEGLSLLPGADVREREARQAVRQFNAVFAAIGAFLLISVIAAGMVATSTFRIVFAQRIRQLALLRAIGGQQRQIGVALSIEGALTGLLAGAVGVGSAYLVVQAVTALAGALGKPLAHSGFPLTAAILTVAGSGAITLASVIAPALSAANVSPLQALRSSDTAPAQAGICLLRLLMGIAAFLAAVLTAAAIWQDLPVAGQEYEGLQENLLLIVVSGTLGYLSLIALGPVLIGAVLTVFGRLVSRTGPTGDLAVAGLRTSSRRAAVVTAVVALGVGLTSGTLVAMDSVRATVSSDLAVTAPADFLVEAGPAQVTKSQLSKLTSDEALSAVTTYRTHVVTFTADNGPQDFLATDMDPDALPALQEIVPAAGSIKGSLDGQAVISDELSFTLGVRDGDPLLLPDGRTVTVKAVLSGNAPLGAALMVSAADLDALGAPKKASGVLIDASGDQREAETRIRSVLGPELSGGLSSLTSDIAPMRQIVAKLFAAVMGLVGLTVLIALVGVGTTMSLTVLERTREFGLLRALGLSRSGVRALIGTEAGLYGLIGSVLGLALGIPYAWLAVLALNLNAPWRLPLSQLVLMTVALILITALAGLLPNRRAARVSPIAALGAGS